jgi:EPS-associated MarR family transcriptional regulator
LNEALQYKILKRLQDDPNISQRDLARELDMSLGKVNYCMKGLINKGWVKVKNFRKSNNKLAYAYLLTPHGMEEKARVTLSFLKLRVSQYEALKKEIDELRNEAESIQNQS